MRIDKDKDKVYVYDFDSRENQKIEIHYDFYYDAHALLDTTAYEVDIQSINVVGSDVDIQWIIDSDLVNDIIKHIEDQEQEDNNNARC